MRVRRRRGAEHYQRDNSRPLPWAAPPQTSKRVVVTHSRPSPATTLPVSYQAAIAASAWLTP
jgi:hypothetical protein